MWCPFSQLQPWGWPGKKLSSRKLFHSCSRFLFRRKAVRIDISIVHEHDRATRASSLPWLASSFHSSKSMTRTNLPAHVRIW